ncbi:MAG: hypothetical protein IPH03_15630 [Tetrasphaera sp.]|jgi:hypothetical protein|nr:hypothetical protein [Tetrasphaera sp.]
MSATPQSSGLPSRLSTGAKICTILAVLLVILAGYLYFVPINIQAQQGVFGCGSASAPPTEAFAKGVCQDLATINRIRALVALLSALVLVGLGFMLFGSGRRPEIEDGHEADTKAEGVDPDGVVDPAEVDE